MQRMETTLSSDVLHPFHERLARANLADTILYPGLRSDRQPVHTCYGGAHLFTSDTPAKLGTLARHSLAEYAPDASTLAEAYELDPDIASAIYPALVDKLAREPIEDFRIDFEDGYGTRSDPEEDGHAEAAAGAVAGALAAGTMPPFWGIRIKALSEELRQRSVRTLDIFLTTLLTRIQPNADATDHPHPFRRWGVVTLPKITSTEQVAVLVDLLELLEQKLHLKQGTIGIELMVESPRAILDAAGRVALPDLLQAAGRRCVGAHFGPYDYTASLDITAAHQRLDHPASGLARMLMQVALSGTGVRLADGPTTIMPIAKHRGASQALTAAQRDENRAAVHHAWRLHYHHVRRGLANGFYQGWDLHPAQLPARYSAVYAFFREELVSTGERLRAFIAQSAQASRVGSHFDDAATGQGLLNYFLRAVGCGAITEGEAVEQSGLTIAELKTRSFLQILKKRGN
jgi:citrate lyase beta subunit